jgi:hypothetical protein
MAALEDHSQQLFTGPEFTPLRVPQLAWRREFGPHGRLDIWRECGLPLLDQ